ncbi:MAG: ankyrin repeat domain-containing protein [Rickettsiales bacterium]|nr:ankyrin repeat domain-containing protein [Rickettsiales bacterium]
MVSSTTKSNVLNQNYDAVIIVGERIDASIYDDMIEQAQSKGLRVAKIVADGDRLDTKVIKKELEGSVDSNTVFHVDIHGKANKVKKGDYGPHNHDTRLEKLKHFVRPKRYHLSEDTSGIIKTIRDLTQKDGKEKGKNTELHLYSCSGGAAIKNNVPGIKLYAHGSRSKLTYENVLLELIETRMRSNEGQSDQGPNKQEMQFSKQTPYTTYIAEHDAQGDLNVTKVHAPKNKYDFENLEVFKTINFKKVQGPNPPIPVYEDKEPVAPQQYADDLLIATTRSSNPEKSAKAIKEGADVNRHNRPLIVAYLGIKQALFTTDGSYEKAEATMKTLLDNGADPTRSGVDTEIYSLNKHLKEKPKSMSKKEHKLVSARLQKLDDMILDAIVEQSQKVSYSDVVNLSAHGELRTDLNHAVHDGNTEKVRRALHNGADVNEQHTSMGVSPLMIAAHKGDTTGLAVVEHLLEQGADANTKDFTAQASPLLIAVSKGDKARDITEALLEAGADPQSVDYKERSALQVAVIQGDAAQDVTELLLKHGADPNEKDQMEQSLLILAVSQGTKAKAVSQMLIHSEGINLDYQEPNSGITALMLAVDKGNIEAVESMLE